MDSTEPQPLIQAMHEAKDLHSSPFHPHAAIGYIVSTELETTVAATMYPAKFKMLQNNKTRGTFGSRAALRNTPLNS